MINHNVDCRFVESAGDPMTDPVVLWLVRDLSDCMRFAGSLERMQLW